MRPGQLRQHARLLRERYANQLSDDAIAALAQADMIDAEAELAEAGANITSPSPEEDCTIIDYWPILGKVERRGGKIISIAHPWDISHSDALRARGIDLAWVFCHDPRRGLDQGALIYIYIGTEAEGPRVLWSASRNVWSTHKSNGNYGRNWSHGGTWNTINNRHAPDLSIIAPDLAQAIKEVTMDQSQLDRITKAKAKIAAAKLQIRACISSDYAAAAMRQASHPAYPGQEAICMDKANRSKAIADMHRAEAELILANAGC